MTKNNFSKIWRYFAYMKSSFSYPEYISFGKFVFKFKNSKLTPGVKYYLSRNISNYELGERELVEQLLIKDDIVIEAGTSLGLISGLIAKTIGEDGQLITLEGDAKLTKIAQSINAENRNITFITGALTFENDEFVYFDRDGWLGGKISKSQNSIKVNAYNFLSLCHEYGPTAVVIDIEGGEIGFLKIEIPNSINKIIIELHPSLYGEEMMLELVEYFSLQDFTLYKKVESVFGFTRNEQKHQP
jgi:FkbM family methyltransferase